LKWGGIDPKHKIYPENAKRQEHFKDLGAGGRGVGVGVVVTLEQIFKQQQTNFIYLTQENAQWRSFVNTKMKFNSRNNRKFSKSAERQSASPAGLCFVGSVV